MCYERNGNDLIPKNNKRVEIEKEEASVYKKQHYLPLSINVIKKLTVCKVQVLHLNSAVTIFELGK